MYVYAWNACRADERNAGMIHTGVLIVESNIEA